MKFNKSFFIGYFFAAMITHTFLHMLDNSYTVFDALFALDLHLFLGIVFGLIAGRKA